MDIGEVEYLEEYEDFVLSNQNVFSEKDLSYDNNDEPCVEFDPLTELDCSNLENSSLPGEQGMRDNPIDNAEIATTTYKSLLTTSNRIPENENSTVENITTNINSSITNDTNITAGISENVSLNVSNKVLPENDQQSVKPAPFKYFEDVNKKEMSLNALYSLFVEDLTSEKSNVDMNSKNPNILKSSEVEKETQSNKELGSIYSPAQKKVETNNNRKMNKAPGINPKPKTFYNGGEVISKNFRLNSLGSIKRSETELRSMKQFFNNPTNFKLPRRKSPIPYLKNDGKLHQPSKIYFETDTSIKKNQTIPEDPLAISTTEVDRDIEKEQFESRTVTGLKNSNEEPYHEGNYSKTLQKPVTAVTGGKKEALDVGNSNYKKDFALRTCYVKLNKNFVKSYLEKSKDKLKNTERNYMLRKKRKSVTKPIYSEKRSKIENFQNINTKYKVNSRTNNSTPSSSSGKIPQDDDSQWLRGMKRKFTGSSSDDLNKDKTGKRLSLEGCENRESGFSSSERFDLPAFVVVETRFLTKSEYQNKHVNRPMLSTSTQEAKLPPPIPTRNRQPHIENEIINLTSTSSPKSLTPPVTSKNNASDQQVPKVCSKTPTPLPPNESTEERPEDSKFKPKPGVLVYLEEAYRQLNKYVEHKLYQELRRYGLSDAIDLQKNDSRLPDLNLNCDMDTARFVFRFVRSFIESKSTPQSQINLKDLLNNGIQQSRITEKVTKSLEASNKKVVHFNPVEEVISEEKQSQMQLTPSLPQTLTPVNLPPKPIASTSTGFARINQTPISIPDHSKLPKNHVQLSQFPVRNLNNTSSIISPQSLVHSPTNRLIFTCTNNLPSTTSTVTSIPQSNGNLQNNQQQRIILLQPGTSSMRNVLLSSPLMIASSTRTTQSFINAIPENTASIKDDDKKRVNRS